MPPEGSEAAQALPIPNPALAGRWAAGSDAGAMRKLITLTLAVLMVGLFAAVVLAAVDAGDDPSTTAGTTVDTTEAGTTTDETTTTETTTTETTTTPEPRRRDDRPAGGVDISGPCDEAEHANDPRCTGVQPRVDDDRGFDDSGHGGGDDD
jgi:hypothetical protein